MLLFKVKENKKITAIFRKGNRAYVETHHYIFCKSFSEFVLPLDLTCFWRLQHHWRSALPVALYAPPLSLCEPMGFIGITSRNIGEGSLTRVEMTQTDASKASLSLGDCACGLAKMEYSTPHSLQTVQWSAASFPGSSIGLLLFQTL